jgi:hypothetical protein
MTNPRIILIPGSDASDLLIRRWLYTSGMPDMRDAVEIAIDIFLHEHGAVAPDDAILEIDVITVPAMHGLRSLRVTMESRAVLEIHPSNPDCLIVVR